MNENTNNNGSRGGRLAALLILLLALIFAVQFVRSSTAQNAASYTMDDFEKDIDDKNVTSVDIVPNAETPTGYARITLHDGTTVTLYATDVTKVEDLARDAKLNPSVEDVADEGTFANYIFPLILVCVMIAFLFYFVNMQSAASGASNARMMNFGKSRAVRADPKNKVTFADVAGLDEEKEDLAEIVDFLKNPSHYTEVGARIPKGVLLEGPPGTGKTLLAKAVAGEAGVPFYSISGSDFVEMFVGVGASRVRDMFEEAKKDSPCIIFIDEIDAVARRRGTGLGGGHDEREQTLNQLLVEMDGFGPNEGIIVMAATNRADILDPAILRPGRFDRKITVSRPDVKGREEILKVHAKGKPLGDDVNLEEIARTTAGFSGADLENLLNEAAIAAARDNRRYIRQEDIKNAFIKVGIGTEKRSHVISPEEKRITAYHESGHAILFHELKDVGPVYTVSIIPTGNGAGGYTMPLPGKDEMYYTRGKMLHEIMVSLGGRIAEEIVLDDITTGASADIQRATSVARQMVTKYGMSSRLGTINYDTQEEDVFLGYDLGHETRNSEYMASEIDKEVKTIIDRCYADAKAIILKHRDVLDKSAALLIEKEKITGEEFDALFT